MQPMCELRPNLCGIERHQILRFSAAGVNVVALRHLFANGFHYPMHLLLLHLTIALLLEGLRSHRGPTDCKWDYGCISRHLLFATFFAAGLICTYQAMLHARHAGFVVMVMGAGWPATFRRVRKDRSTTTVPYVCFLVPLAGLGLILIEESLLTRKGIELALVAALLAAVASVSLEYINMEDAFNLGKLHVRAHSCCLGLVIPVVIIEILATGKHKARDFDTSGQLCWIAASAVSGALTLGSCETLKTYTLSERPTAGSWQDHRLLRPDGVAFSAALLMIVEVDNALAITRPQTTTVGQVAAFVLVCFSTIDVPNATHTAASHIEVARRSIKQGYKTMKGAFSEHEGVAAEEGKEYMLPRDESVQEESTRGPSEKQPFSLALSSALGSLMFILVLYSALVRLSSTKLVGGWPVDRANSSLDIVIANYAEPVEQVVHTANVLLASPSVLGRSVRTIVYSKGLLNETDLRTKFPGKLEIRHLDNSGREGGSYLSHIEREQDLADHTLFIQAEPHDPHYLRARLDDYFVPDTGFLSLSMSRNFCEDCQRCNDHSGWSENGSFLDDVYRKSNGGQSCGGISLTYRGQFVVSSARLRSLDRELMVELGDMVGEDEDFGFTLERIWGLLFSCPTISPRCPSLLGGWLGNHGTGGVADCQCLDTA